MPLSPMLDLGVYRQGDGPTMVQDTSPPTLECAFHPGRETSLRCGRCGKPICVKCIVQTPVGARCKECAQVRALPTYRADPLTVARAGIAGLIVSAVGFTLVFIFFRAFSMWLSIPIGLAVGEAISFGSNRKRAHSLQTTAAAAVVIGALLAETVQLYLRVGYVSVALVGRVLIADLLTLAIVAVLGTALAISRLR